jgi:hypothetical protein
MILDSQSANLLLLSIPVLWVTLIESFSERERAPRAIYLLTFGIAAVCISDLYYRTGYPKMGVAIYCGGLIATISRGYYYWIIDKLGVPVRSSRSWLSRDISISDNIGWSSAIWHCATLTCYVYWIFSIRPSMVFNDARMQELIARINLLMGQLEQLEGDKYALEEEIRKSVSLLSTEETGRQVYYQLAAPNSSIELLISIVVGFVVGYILERVFRKAHATR